MGRGGNREPLPRPTQVSKKLSWLLRHGAEEEGLTFLSGGYLPVLAVLANRKFRSMKVTFPEIREVVAADQKKRYSMVPTGEASSEDSDKPEDWLIRANQGHSVKVEESTLLTPVTAENMPVTAVHGTTHAAWPLIVTTGGLKPITRTHVHFASGLPEGFKSVVEKDGESAAGAPVISGMRKTSTILIFVDVPKAVEAGIQFGISDNGVVLTEGNKDGLVPLDMFKRVEDRTGHGVLVEGGKVIKEAPASWGSKVKAKG